MLMHSSIAFIISIGAVNVNFVRNFSLCLNTNLDLDCKQSHKSVHDVYTVSSAICCSSIRNKIKILECSRTTTYDANILPNLLCSYTSLGWPFKQISLIFSLFFEQFRCLNGTALSDMFSFPTPTSLFYPPQMQGKQYSGSNGCPAGQFYQVLQGMVCYNAVIDGSNLTIPIYVKFNVSALRKNGNFYEYSSCIQ